MNTDPPQLDTDPWQAILYWLAFIMFFMVLISITSCARLESIPFSVSYQDQSGETFTVATQIPIHREK